MLLVMLQLILIGILEKQLVSSITMRLFIKDLLPLSTLLVRNSQLTIFLSSGLGNSITLLFSLELLKDGMIFTL